MQLTWYDANSWLIEINNKRILLDPWFVGSLVFGNQNWFYKGDKSTHYEVPKNIDLILLSQGLPDHSHPPTLKKLDHNIPVLGSPNAAKICLNLEYQKVDSLSHGETFILDQKISIKAIPGSLVGFNLIENGYIIKDLKTGESIYYEPHGFHSSTLKNEESVNVIITPLTSLKLPLVGAFIKGEKSSLEVCEWLKPKYILPTTNGGEVKMEGFLNNFITEEGTIDDFNSLLKNNNLSTEIVKIKPGKTVKLIVNS
jgi:L-ascorbate metabolism protein UlaG (beta-lactamase superfamily)